MKIKILNMKFDFHNWHQSVLLFKGAVLQNLSKFTQNCHKLG